MDEHTPGPWRIEGKSVMRGVTGHIISAGFNAHRDGPADYVGLFGPFMTSEVKTADLHLALAAPDLLEVAQMVLDTATVETPRELLQAATDAIAKATGKGE